MSNYSLLIQSIESPLKPSGLNGLKLVIEKKKEEVFFRQKLAGSLEFMGEDYLKIKTLEKECCKDLTVTVKQSCEGDKIPFYFGRIKTSEIDDWDFELCTAKLNGIGQNDDYLGVYKYWGKKVNMCATVKNQTVRYTNRIVVSSTVTNYTAVSNPNGIYFTDWLYACITKTFTGTEYARLIPADKNAMSDFLSRAINPCTGKRNQLNTGIVYQTTDFMFSQSQPATGVLNTGLINESLGLSLKELLEDLRNTFDLYWHIEGGKFKIEHLSYFENNLSYTANNGRFSLDLSSGNFEKFLKNYGYNYKNNQEEFYGVEELKMSLNEGVFKGSNASLNVYPTNYGTEIYQESYVYGVVNDFELGNIKFNQGCVPTDETGEVKKVIRNSNLFITATEPLRLADESVDKNKWVLLDCKKVGTSTVLNDIVEGTCERTTKIMPNANFSASTIMRDYLRYKKPFNAGLMNYSDTPNGLIGKGFNRTMHSLIRSKKLKKISIPFCCSDEPFNANLMVKMPNGSMANVWKADFQLADSMLGLELEQVSNCGYNPIFPEVQNQEDCPAKGTVLGTEQVLINKGSQTICDDNGNDCYNTTVYVGGTRTNYADGDCGSYFEDVENT